MSDTSTKRALEVAKFHETSEALYADNPEDSGRRAMHHISANLLRSLAAERDALKAENAWLREALDFYGDVSKYPAPFTGGMGALWQDCGQIARAALGEKQ